MGERAADVGGQRPCTKHVSGLVSNMPRCGVKWGKGGRCGWTEAVCQACFTVSLKHVTYVYLKKMTDSCQPFSAVDFDHTERKKKVLLLGSRAHLVLLALFNFFQLMGLTSMLRGGFFQSILAADSFVWWGFERTARGTNMASQGWMKKLFKQSICKIYDILGAVCNSVRCCKILYDTVSRCK